MSDRTAPSEGSASSPREIANELNRACDALRVVDYNALNPDELGEVLEAFHTLNELCLQYRRRQSRDNVDLSNHTGNAPPDETDK